MTVSKARIAKWQERWAEARKKGQDPLQDGVDALRRWEADPLGNSALPYWLALEVWSQEEGLLVLCGVEPDTVTTDGDPFYSDLGVGHEWINAQPFVEHRAFSFAPVPHDLTDQDYESNPEGFESYLQEVERRRDVLRPLREIYLGLEHKLSHSPSALGEEVTKGHWRPLAFLAWAETLRFKPSWLDWAKSSGRLPDALDAMKAPYFDADSATYPELLHIAVRAWETAQRETAGTPKQRIEHFLLQHYPALTASTRAAIALVANWQKVGGRPKNVE